MSDQFDNFLAHKELEYKRKQLRNKLKAGAIGVGVGAILARSNLPVLSKILKGDPSRGRNILMSLAGGAAGVGAGAATYRGEIAAARSTRSDYNNLRYGGQNATE